MSGELFLWVYSPTYKPKAEVGGLVAANIDEARRALIEMLPGKTQEVFPIEADDGSQYGEAVQSPNKRVFSWFISATDTDVEDVLGVEPGESAMPYVVFAESGDSWVGPHVCRAPNIVAALNAALSHEKLKLAGGKSADQLDMAATEHRVRIDDASWANGDRAGETNATLVIRWLEMDPPPHRFDLATWQRLR
ncbi:MAG: hypothetical protein KDB68_00760 [Planctomycetes bacterium]|nr:hypothetical protein [Planctomycetota bacterium]MCA9563666.1 hypothetical protein [Myxococcales bacterium]